ncbi:MAG: ATP-grasp domain-containing protein [Patescibacteria group bacterium]
MHKQNPYNYQQWKHLIPDIETVIQEMEKTPIISVGITPYTRIVPAFFLKNYSIYTIKRSSDVDVMESMMHMHVLEDKHPDIAARVHGTGYLIGNYTFQNYLKSQPRSSLLFYTMTDKITQDLDRLKIPWIGNYPKSFEEVKYKGSFRELVKKLGLNALPSKLHTRNEYLTQSFEALWTENSGPFVVQRADKETGGNEGTFFIYTKEDFDKSVAILTPDTDFQRVVIAPFIEGQSTSMLGCITEKGTLTGPLQLQLIDVPQSLHGVPANGIFFGNDIGFRGWSDEIEKQAQKVVEGIGAHLAAQGYKGIFGIDFLYDKKRDQIYPNECNPRFTGSLLLYSLMLLEAGLPPFEFFHLMAHLKISSSFDFEKVNAALKTRLPCAHISFSPKGIPQMKLPLLAGVYSYDAEKQSLAYKGPGMCLADLQNKNDFMLIDTVPRMNEPIEEKVPRLFKFIFRRTIAKSSYEVDTEAAFLVDSFAKALQREIEAARQQAPS